MMLRNEKGLKIGPTSHRRSRISLSPTGSWDPNRALYTFLLQLRPV